MAGTRAPLGGTPAARRSSGREASSGMWQPASVASPPRQWPLSSRPLTPFAPPLRPLAPSAPNAVPAILHSLPLSAGSHFQARSV
ncbi:hypothetical protein ZWY2020_053318 [Hordeum vulgare]|nr:hypothetical protein ZWY2020_053318 [Hordeum vulgare]